jgi:methylenetetrahydrofolate reductase (NADPH)
MKGSDMAADAPGKGIRDIRVSFEFFPPKSAKMEASLWEAITRLAPLRPSFVSATVARLLRETHLRPAAHLTCVGATRDEVDEVIQAYWADGVRHIVALRGDAAGGAGEPYAPHPGGYVNSADLVGGIKGLGDFEISVAAYPEKHPDSPDMAADIAMLKAKIDAGATRAITQFFFDNDHYFRYLDAVRAAGINVPIVPGIIPVHNFAQVARFAGQCGAVIPARMAARFDGLDDDVETTHLMAATVAAEQVLGLVGQGVREFHFYTLNRASLVYAICHLLGIRPEEGAGADNAAAISPAMA